MQRSQCIFHVEITGQLLYSFPLLESYFSNFNVHKSHVGNLGKMQILIQDTWVVSQEFAFLASIRVPPLQCSGSWPIDYTLSSKSLISFFPKYAVCLCTQGQRQRHPCKVEKAWSFAKDPGSSASRM